MLEVGNQNRTVAATALNADSSRSHAIFQLHLTRTDSAAKRSLSAAINLVDLAGSERVDKVSGRRHSPALSFQHTRPSIVSGTLL